MTSRPHHRHPPSADEDEQVYFHPGVTWVGGAIVLLCLGVPCGLMIIAMIRDNPVAGFWTLVLIGIMAVIASWFGLVHGRKVLRDVIRQNRLRRTGTNRGLPG